jgi:hypothetical protein
LTSLLQRFGYQYLLKDVSTVTTIIPAIPAVIADPTASILAAPAVPASLTFSNPIKIMDVYSEDKLLDISQKHALLMWGDGLFTNQTPRVISELTQADGHLTAAGQLTQSGKDIIQERLLLKVMASQIFALLSDKARKVIEHQSNEYTWRDANGIDKEMDGMTITALILWHLCPHHKVDMYSEMGTVKKMTIAQFDNNINLFFDEIRSSKLQIDSKDPLAYTDNAFVCDIFAQLKNKMLPHDFRSEFTSLDRCWQMDKEKSLLSHLWMTQAIIILTW